IDLIDMRTRKDGEFKWIAHARVLTDKCVAKVAVFLFDIFIVFGLPIFLQSNNEREFTADVINNLTKLWPNLKIIHRKPWRPQTQGSVERANYILKDKLGKWLEDRQSENEDLYWTVENIPDDVQIEDDIQSDDDENSIQTEYYNDEFNKNLIQNLSQSENSDRDSMFFIMA
ncbi:7938_t:CDS:2, partial [Gigaspora margarita]